MLSLALGHFELSLKPRPVIPTGAQFESLDPHAAHVFGVFIFGILICSGKRCNEMAGGCDGLRPASIRETRMRDPSGGHASFSTLAQRNRCSSKLGSPKHTPKNASYVL